MGAETKTEFHKAFYHQQNKAIHMARAQLCMQLDDCRKLASEINGKASISSMSLRDRWELIEILKAKGARVYNPPLYKLPVSLQGRPQHPPLSKVVPAPHKGACFVRTQEKPQDVYPARLAYWDKRFAKQRPGFASNKELAWIQSLWELDFYDGRTDSKKGLRGFVWRQTKNLEQGPVSDLAFLRGNHVQAVMMPLKERARKKQGNRSEDQQRKEVNN